MDISNLINARVGDILTLSDLQTQISEDESKKDYLVIDIRTYTEPNAVFKFTGLIFQDDEERDMMLLIREVDKESDYMLYYMDNEGNMGAFREYFLTEDGKDLTEAFNANVEGIEIEWVKKSAGTHFGIEYQVESSENDEEPPVTIAEYQNDQWENYPHC